jgi:broad specificity phosphatase PhoE
MTAYKHIRELVIVRHGEAQLNVAQREAIRDGHPRFDGTIRQTESPLTEKGILQAEATGKFLANEPPFHRVFVSPYLRTMQTAEIMTRRFPYQAEIRYEERIRERESGIFAGLTRRAIREKYPEEFERNEREGRYYFRPLGGESYPDVNLRVQSFLTSMKHNFPGQRILVVSHAVVIWCFRRVLERLSERDLLSLLEHPDNEIVNASVTTYKADTGGRLRLQEFARTYFTSEDANEIDSDKSTADYK